MRVKRLKRIEGGAGKRIRGRRPGKYRPTPSGQDLPPELREQNRDQ
jgi:hypothetical protein